MRSMPKLVMGVTLIMGASLLLVLALVLVLLAELYCSLLSKRSRPQIGNTAASHQGSEEDPPIAAALPTASLSPGGSAYDQGVLRAPPKGLLFPTLKEHLQQSHHACGTSLHFMGLISTSSLPTPSLVLSRCPPAPPQLPTIVTAFEENNSIVEEDGSGNTDFAAGGGGGDNFIYISNPIYDSEEAHIVDTPFQTPDTSPSQLLSPSPSPPTNYTPPLTPMKKLPPSASSVTLMDGRSLGTDSNADSSSSSGSPCTSPSW
ncbi:hypothetical protein MRB53_009330 [Persea americana]|uniref:Uncharacterized protein n=1 Tax=Persea americana TaxID=3435 RepID=A0ACC2LNT2_PERAE|nr:hypothetical protein MRB53_009330 [Persea americana]